MRRPALLAVLATAALAAAGCGNSSYNTQLGQDEGSYLDAGPLTYQVQLSRYLNPSDVEDAGYLKGLPPGTSAPTGNEEWFGVFMRVQNFGKQTQTPTTDFSIVDTQHNVYRPLPIDTRVNPFAYQPVPLRPRAIYPDPNSVAGQGAIQGSLLLFKVSLSSLQNRPLEFKIDSPLPPPLRKSATIDLDV
jgi:hypothetical protein